MTNTTIAAEIRSQHRGVWFLLISLVLHLVVLGTVWHFDFLGITHLDTDQQQEQPLREIALNKLKKEREEKQKQKLPEEHAEKLVKEEEKRSVKEMVEKVKVLEKQNQELEKIREMKLEEIKEEPREATVDRIKDKVRELKDRAVEIDKYNHTPLTEELKQKTVKLDQIARSLNKENNTERSEKLEDQLEKQLEDFQEKARETIDDKQASNRDKHFAKELLEMSKAINPNMPALDDPQLSPNVAQAQQMLDQTPPPTQSTDQAQLEQMPPEELFDKAKALEEKADQTFAQIKAAELALQQNSTLNEAQKNISHTPPDRPEMGKELAKQKSELQTREDLNEFRKQLDKTVKEVDAMKVATDDKVKQAQGMAQMSKAFGNQATPQQQYRARAMMQKFSSGNQANVDMSSLMRQMSMGLAATTSQSSSSGQDSDHRITEGGTGGYDDPDDIAPTNIKGINIPSNKVMAQALPGQKFSRKSARHGWLYLDTWYIIGPWENYGKLDHREIFPPELSIDFDARYNGKITPSGPKKGQPMELKWQFTQSGRIQVVPPMEYSNSVYYAYTEIHFEEDTDMLLAVASDDSSKLWINDIAVWDDKTHSDWRIGEGSRKVFFRKGYNRLLLRLENRGSETEFSVLICPTTFE